MFENVEAVPNEPVPNVSGIAADTDLIQKIYSRCRIFYFSSQKTHGRTGTGAEGGGLGGGSTSRCHPLKNG